MTALFWIVAFIVIFAALNVVMQKNPMASALSLVLAMVAIAVLFLSLHAYFIAVVQVIVYAGAVMVLFLFVIMLLRLDAIAEKFHRGYVAVAVALALLFGGGIYFGLARHLLKGAKGEFAPDQMASQLGIRTMAQTLFTDYLYPFELLSLVLLVAMIGVAVMTGRNKNA